MLKEIGTGARHQMGEVFRRAVFIWSCSSRVGANWRPQCLAAGPSWRFTSGDEPGLLGRMGASHLALPDRLLTQFFPTHHVAGPSWNSVRASGWVCGSFQFSTSPTPETCPA